MEKNMVGEHHLSGNSNLISKSVESSIKIDSISIDLINANEKTSAQSCEHFSIRGYVSELREKDWKMCLPFDSYGDSKKNDDQACGLPPLHVPKFRYWRCQNCLWDIGAKGIGNVLFSDFQQAPKIDILKEKKADANASANLGDRTDYHPSSCIGKKETETEVANGPALGRRHGELDDNLNQEMHTLTTEISSLMQKTLHTDGMEDLQSKLNGSTDLYKSGSGHHEVDGAELSENLNCVAVNAVKFHEPGKVISAAIPHKELRACGMSGEGGNMEEASNSDKCRESGHPSLELDECDYASSENAEIMIGNSPQDSNRDNSSGSHRRKTRKVRLLTELLCKNGDGESDNSKIDGFLSNAIPDTSEAGNKLHVLQGQVATQGNFRRVLSQPRKRKSDPDEDWRPLEAGSSNKAGKVVRTLKRDVESADAIAKAFAEMHLQTRTKKHCTKRRIDGSSSICRKKNKKVLNNDDSSSLVPTNRRVPNEICNIAGDDSNGNVADGVLLKEVHNAVIDKEADFFASSAQRMVRKPSFKKKSKMHQVDDQQAPIIPQNHGMLKEDLSTRKNVEFFHSRPVMVPFYSAQNVSGDKGPNRSVNSFLNTQRYDTQNNSQVKKGQISVLTLQEGNEDHVNRKAAETKYLENFIFASKPVPDMPFGKGAYSDLSSKRTTDRMPFLNERQNYTSQVGVGNSHMQQKDFYSTSCNFKRIGIQENSASTRKDSDQKTNKVSEQGALDDIPMEIVELMAKHQYERCLPDTEFDRYQSEMTSNTKSVRTMDFNAYGKGEKSLFKPETTEKRNLHAKYGRNGIVKRDENVGPAKQKSVDCFSSADLNQLSMSKLRPPTPAGPGTFFQVPERLSSSGQHSASGSGRLNNAQSYKWIGDIGNRSLHNCLQSSGTCNICHGISEQSKETTHIWPSMMPNHMPFVYSIPQKCAAITTNLDVLNSPSSMHKENTDGNRDLKFLNQNAAYFGKNRKFGSDTLRRCAEYSFACKRNEIELNQKPMGSLELYSNETIPAMHLLSLMDAGLRSSGPINLDIAPKFLKRPSVTHDQDPKEFSRMDSGAYKATNIMKHTSYGYDGKNQLAEDSHRRISAIPVVVGPSSSSFHRDKCLDKVTDFIGQVSQEKVNRKGSDVHKQNRGCRLQKPSPPSGNFGTSCGSIPVHSMQTMFFGPPGSMVFPLQVHGLENSTKHKSEAFSGIRHVNPHRGSSEIGLCSVNRNPADFSAPEAGNTYMIAGEDLRFGKAVPFSNGNRTNKLAGLKRQKKLPARRHLIS